MADKSFQPVKPANVKIFDYITAAIMLVLGIGITQLLSDVVDAFRSRQSYRLHWIPITWAALVFAWQMQFLWAVYELKMLQTSWHEVEFLILLLLAMLLFVAGSLVVPRAGDESDNALEQFRADGRWTLVVLAAYFFIGYVANVLLFNLHWLDPVNLQDPVLGLYLLIVVFRTKTQTWAIATIIFAIVSVFSIISLSPTRYG
ncbi:hypothetical protein [Microbulbifer sp. SAOS-129_SWC]|uniref:hypothetical protein n=1 Tax=Microbulbifer sp. SAOS-129_SWC TaxID=3145235 RepID=UPI003217615A